MSRSQRYKLTFEFALRDRGDYEAFRSQIYKALKDIGDDPGFAADHLVIEKVPDDRT